MSTENKILQESLNFDYVSKEEIRELIKKYREEKDENKKEELRNIIFQNNIRHIRKIAFKFSRMYADAEDCFQNGVLGFFDALERFDLEKDTAFTTYLFYWVYKYIFEGSQRSIISIPRNVQFMNYSFSKYKEIMDRDDMDNNKEFLNNKIFQNEVFIKKYLNNENVNVDIKVSSIDEDVSKDNSNKKLFFVNILRDTKPSPEQEVLENINREQLIAIINTKLSERERDIIMLRYFNDSDKLMTLKEIVEVMGTTSERVRQIEERALGKLKRVFIKLQREECF